MSIVASCKLNASSLIINNQLIHAISGDTIDWKRELYNFYSKDYPKFHKMDPLAKMAFLGILGIEKKTDLSVYDDNEVSMIFANKTSSYKSDSNHFENYTKKNLISPSDFVYTLPNILTGELAIYLKWYGENCFYILEKFDLAFYIEQIEIAFSKGKKACLCGWVESSDKSEDLIIFIIENQNNKINKEEIYSYFK